MCDSKSSITSVTQEVEIELPSEDEKKITNSTKVSKPRGRPCAAKNPEELKELLLKQLEHKRAYARERARLKKKEAVIILKNEMERIYDLYITGKLIEKL